MSGKLFAISDLHVAYEENRAIADRLRPESADDWLIVAGDVGETFADIESTLRRLRARFATVIWAPGNHELWTPRDDPVRLRGEERYHALVRMCRELDVVTPEDPYPLWPGPGGPIAVAPLFVLYDYTFRPAGTYTRQQALDRAYRTGVVCNDEMMLHPDPYPDRDAWCAQRLRVTRERLDELPAHLPTVLVNHYPLVREPTRILRYPEFALWCGTVHTADWHRRYRAAAVVYGHLHIPRHQVIDGVPFYEVSLGYPREWRIRPGGPGGLRQILPLASSSGLGDPGPQRAPVELAQRRHGQLF
ncbi:metallophosphoesterase family protein [Dactylosporangium sp. NPDC051541]|uniref:metallophosphoesterase family protein n=1 Tax=Dactylosporangium sp. NPDC051541 TaxID=3363977 RepID=UPI0037948B6A